MNNVPGWNQEAPMYLAPLVCTAGSHCAIVLHPRCVLLCLNVYMAQMAVSQSRSTSYPPILCYPLQMGGGFTWAPVLPLFPGYRRMGPAYHTIRAILEQPDGARLALLHGNAGAGKSSLATDVGQGMTADGILAGERHRH
jgi:hypothetical protein